MQKVQKNRDKSDENGTQKVSGASKMSPAASRRRPRASKKRPGGAKLDLVVFYRLFKLTPVHRRHKAQSRNNLPVREVNWTKQHPNINFSAHLRSDLLRSNTHWCAGGHGADLKAEALCRRPPTNYNKCQKCKFKSSTTHHFAWFEASGVFKSNSACRKTFACKVWAS